MDARPTTGKTKEVPCPACGAPMSAPQSARRRKVQCPSCREIVTLGAAEIVVSAPTETAAPQVAELWLRFARLETLEGRVMALEKVVAQAVPPVPPVAEASASRKLKWVPCDPVQSQTLSPELEEALLHNLGTFQPRAITIQSPANDPAARQRAEWLKSIFERSKWVVHGPGQAASHHRSRGLVFAVGALPLPDAAAATLLALTAAGFEVTSRLEPNLSGDEAILIVG